MKILKALSVIAMSACLALSATAQRVDHFEGKPSETLSDALNNFAEYNRLLEERLSGELTNEDLMVIHQLTYTLENALEKINQELSDLAEVLEGVHIASENFDREALAQPAEEYLRVIKILEK